MGATGIEVPAQHFGHDLAAMRQAITDDTRVVFVANPNNPTGTLVAPDMLEAFIADVPRTVLIVVDEAYHEYLPPDLQSDSIEWLTRYPNLAITRTFSKIYGLAGLRVGYAFAHPRVADLMNRVRQPFNVNSLSLAAAAAAIRDNAFVARSHELNHSGMRQITAGLETLGLDYIPSFGNFVSFRVPDCAGVYRRLLRLGVIVRPIASYGMPDYLRVTIGLEEENRHFLESLAQALPSSA
jgi:histidinol-phosphate aminotransferase